ncbi:ABC transporter substrate-binding protein [Maridesulfovibrio sp.]|uniref:substrate-binding periplasmic protein n=1 Tax=Maridesulfovibrio sp. TaxID=2795000 RepID=UPI002A18B2A0|nr:ABC transporter substrate-binding protein [Maridesulfovibrio sp.]
MKRILTLLVLTICFAAISAQAADVTVITEIAPPLSFEENGKLTGASTELVEEIMRRTGKVYPIEVQPWARGYHLAQTDPNVALFSTTRTEARENMFKWVGPLAVTQWVFWAKAGSGISISSLDDAKKVESIATYKDDAKEQLLKDKGFTNLDSSANLATNLKKLMAGRNALWIAGYKEGQLVAKENGFDPSKLEKVFVVKEVKLYVAFSKSTPDSIVNEWQKAFDSMEADGFVKKVNEKWANR